MILPCLFAVIALGHALQFSSPVEIHKDNAVLRATFYYSDTLKAIRYDYTDPVTMTELQDYNENIKYKHCSSCEAGYISGSFPVLATLPSDSITTSGETTIYTRAAGSNVEYLTYRNNRLVEFKWNNAVYKLSNYQTLSDENKFKYTDFSNSCPRPVCKRVIDIIFVLDESGSIAEQEWVQTIDFCKNIIDGYEIGYDAAQVGIVGFGAFGIKYLDLSSSKTAIIQKFDELLDKQHRGGTCTGCGLMIAKTMFDGAKDTQRTKDYNPEHLLITITDGEVTHPDYTYCVKQMKTTKCDYCIGCCTGNTDERESDYKYRTKETCSVYNKTFTVPNWKRSYMCKRSTYSDDGYSCTGCWCDKDRTTMVCDKCSIKNYYSRSWSKGGCSYEGCRSEDGKGNYYKTNFTNSVEEIKKDERLLSIAIGVNEYDEDQLKKIATSLEGLQTVFALADYSELSGILDKLIKESCSSIKTVEDCGPACAGFCGCGKKCYCPTCVEYKETCVENKCEVDNMNLASTGCVLKEVECPHDMCTTLTRNNNTPGCCTYAEKECNDNRFCTDDICVPKIGCVFEVNESRCDDLNGCTRDTCNDINGCEHELYDFCSPPDVCQVVDVPCNSTDSTHCTPATFKPKCTCDDPCFKPECNPVTGECSCVPIDCSVNNSCLLGYCLDGKCLVKDNMEKINECHQLSTDCSIGICRDGECVNESIPCTACQENETFVSECESKSNACEKYKCRDVDGVATCMKYWEMAISPDKCLGESCDPDTGFMSIPMPLVKTENCVKYVCQNGGYVPDEDLCPQETKCYAYICTDNTSCVPKPKCPENDGGNKCRPLKRCDEDEGCIYEDVVCQSGRCYESFCNMDTGKCEKLDNSTECNIYPDDKCKTYKCDEYLGCVYEDVNCDDNDPCTIDQCIEGICHHEPKCVSDDYCLVTECSSLGVCAFSERVCPPANDSCFISVCENGTCTLQPSAGAFFDICGECITKYGNVYNRSGDVCIGSLKRGEFAAAISAAAVAGIIVAAIIVAAVIAASTSMGIKELVKRAKITTEPTMYENPLYEANDNMGINPLYEGDD